MGAYDCNNEYRLFNYKHLLNTLKHEIGHTVGVFHTNDKENLMYNNGDEIGDNKALIDYNPRNLAIPSNEHADIFKDYGYVINQARMKMYTDGGSVDIQKIIDCFYNPSFLSYDWFNLEYRKIFYTLTGNT